jgi:hypothetical protein
MTSSRAGIPSGNTDFSKASRSIPLRPAGLCRVLLAAGVLTPEPLVAGADDERLVRRLVTRADRPATPCARLRCAPNAAARPNVRPHSGQTNSPDFAFAADLLEATRLLLARLLLARLLLTRLVLPFCLFDVDMSSLRLRGDLLNLRVSVRASH